MKSLLSMTKFCFCLTLTFIQMKTEQDIVFKTESSGREKDILTHL